MEMIEQKLSEIPYIDKLLEIKGIGLKTVSRIFYVILTKGVSYDGGKMLQDIMRPHMVAA